MLTQFYFGESELIAKIRETASYLANHDIGHCSILLAFGKAKAPTPIFVYWHLSGIPTHHEYRHPSSNRADYQYPQQE